MPIALSEPVLRVFSAGSKDLGVLAYLAHRFRGGDVLCLSSDTAVREAFAGCTVYEEDDGRAGYAAAFFEDPGAYERLVGRARVLVSPGRFPLGSPVGRFFVAGSDDETVPDLGRFPDAVLAVNRLLSREKDYRINLYLSYYRDASDERQVELDECLLANALHPSIDRVFVLDETGALATPFPKMVVVRATARPTFRDFFRFSDSVTAERDVNVLANSDVLLGDGFQNIRLGENQAICLSRYEPEDDGVPRVRVGGGSHDCWVWRGRMRAADAGDFRMGKFLCDGVLAEQLFRAGYELKNPVHGLMVYHHHRSAVRGYGHHDLVRGPRSGVAFSRHDGVFRAGDRYDDGTNP